MTQMRSTSVEQFLLSLRSADVFVYDTEHVELSNKVSVDGVTSITSAFKVLEV